MDEIALGCLGWKPEDFDRYTVKDLIKASKGYRADKKEHWEMTRVLAAYMAAPYNKKIKQYSDIKLPIDPFEEKPKSSITKLSKEEVIEKYKKAGFEIKDEYLNRMFHGN